MSERDDTTTNGSFLTLNGLRHNVPNVGRYAAGAALRTFPDRYLYHCISDSTCHVVQTLVTAVEQPVLACYNFKMSITLAQKYDNSILFSGTVLAGPRAKKLSMTAFSIDSFSTFTCAL